MGRGHTQLLLTNWQAILPFGSIASTPQPICSRARKIHQAFCILNIRVMPDAALANDIRKWLLCKSANKLFTRMHSHVRLRLRVLECLVTMENDEKKSPLTMYCRMFQQIITSGFSYKRFNGLQQRGKSNSNHCLERQVNYCNV